METPTCLKQEARYLKQRLNDLIWNDAEPKEIEAVKSRLEIVNLKLETGQTHDWRF